MIPGQEPAAGRPAAVSDQRKEKGGAAETAEPVALAGSGRDLPARHGRAGQVRPAMAQQKPDRIAFARREGEPPRHRQVGGAVREFGDHGGEGPAFERFFHRPRHVAGVRYAHENQAMHRQAEGIEPRSVRTAGFERGQFGLEPHGLSTPFDRQGRERRDKAGRCAEMRWRGGGEFVHRPDGQTSAEHAVERGHAEAHPAAGIAPRAVRLDFGHRMPERLQCVM